MYLFHALFFTKKFTNTTYTDQEDPKKSIATKKTQTLLLVKCKKYKRTVSIIKTIYTYIFMYYYVLLFVIWISFLDIVQNWNWYKQIKNEKKNIPNTLKRKQLN